MTPDPLVEDDLKTGALVELIANKPVDVPLYWQCWRLNVQALQRHTGGTTGGGACPAALTRSSWWSAAPRFQ